MTADPGSPKNSPAPGAPTTDTARILLVDDDPINQTVALNLLRRRGYQAEAVANGKQAIERLATQSFDMVFMDLQMPELDGFQTASQIRSKEAAHAQDDLSRLTSGPPPRTPIIALTTASQPGTRERCLASGMDDYLPKPIIPKDLFAMVEKYAALRAQRPTP